MTERASTLVVATQRVELRFDKASLQDVQSFLSILDSADLRHILKSLALKPAKDQDQCAGILEHLSGQKGGPNSFLCALYRDEVTDLLRLLGYERDGNTDERQVMILEVWKGVRAPFLQSAALMFCACHMHQIVCHIWHRAMKVSHDLSAVLIM